MNAYPLIAARVTPETKARLHALAQRHQLSDSALLKRLIDMALLQTADDHAPIDPPEPVALGARVYVRLRAEDHFLLRERAAARGMAAATYVSKLVRAHLRRVTPIPDRERAALDRAVAALGAVGRNLNQIARVANETGRAIGPAPQDLQALLRACTALRDHFKAFIYANDRSWEFGHAETHR